MIRIEFAKTADGRKYRAATERTSPDGTSSREEHPLPEQEKTKGRTRHVEAGAAQTKEGE